MDTRPIARALKWAKANPMRAAWAIPGYVAFTTGACVLFGPPAALLLVFGPLFTGIFYAMGYLLFSEVL